ncbi:MAG: tetratricopeptide repeat protein [Elusimicrobiales bacterium]
MSFVRKTFCLTLCLAGLAAAAVAASPYRAAAGRLAAGLPAKAGVAVLPFLYIGEAGNSRGGQVVAERLTTELAGNKKLRLLERALLDKVLGEMKPGAAGLAGEDGARAAGKLLGADYVIIGSLNRGREGGLELNARAVETATGRVKSAAAAAIAEDWLEEMPALPAGPLPENELFKLCWAGLRALDRGDSAAAAASFDKALEADPVGACGLYSPGLAWRARGKARANLGDLAGARKDLDAGLKAAPGDPGLLALRGAVHIQAGRLKEAVKDYDELVRLDPETPDAWLRRGRALALGGDLEAGVKDLTRAMELGGGGPDAYTARGAMLMHQGKFAEAERDLDRAVELGPDLGEVYYTRALLYGKQGLFKKTLEATEALVELEPWRPQSYLERGTALSALHRFDAALADFTKALDLDPDYAKAWCYRGMLYRTRLRNEEALADFDRALGLNPGYVDALMGRAQAYVDMGKPGEALKDIGEVIALEKPLNPGRYYSRAVLFGRLGKMKQAIEDLDRYIALVPDNPAAYEARAYSYEQLGRKAEARADIDKLLELRARAAAGTPAVKKGRE